jgi:mRNA-degrading endonuclease RelE of RelBE toxin-antitoxin system
MLTIAFAKTLDRVPPEVRDQLRSRLEEIARTLASLPSGGAVWDSLYESGMLLEVGGWRFQYRIDRDKQQIVVQAAQFRDR